MTFIVQWIGIFLLAFTPSARAAEAPSLLKTPPPQWVNAHEVIVLLPAEKHHFNLEAPQKCGAADFLEKSPRRLRCQLSQAGQQNLKVAVCDDKKTFCRIEDFTVEVRQSQTWKGQKIKDDSPVYRPRSERHAVPGFLDNQAEKAQAMARQKGQLLLIDFYGIWCPPCNMLDEWVYPQAEFQSATQNMVKVSLDADSDLSWAWKDHFHIRGYPTLIIANAELQEIHRMVGFKELPAVLAWIKKSQELMASPVELLVQNKNLSPAEKLRLSEWYYERGEYEKCQKIAKNLPAGSEGYLLFLQSSAELASQSQQSAQRLTLLKKMLRSYGQNIEMPSWLLELKEEKDAAATAGQLKKALVVLAQWRESPQRIESGYTVHDLLGMEAELLTAFDKKEAAQVAFLSAAQAAEKLAGGKDSQHLKGSRGVSLDWAYYLYKAGKFDEAKALYQSLIAIFPKEFTFNYNFAYVLNELKQWDEAAQYAAKAETVSYGDNWLRAVALLSKIELARQRPKEALKILNQSLAEVHLPQSTQVRTHRYVATLRDLQQKAQAAATQP